MEELAARVRALSSKHAVLAGILLVALAARVYAAGLPLWFDELASIFFARQPLDHLWGGWMVRETNPPLYYTLLKAWLAISPYELIAFRLPSILAGVASIWVCHGIVRRLHSRSAADIAALLLALSSIHIYFSHEMRGYVFAFLGVAVALRGLVSWIEGLARGEDRPGGMIVYALASLFAIYNHTTLILWPPAATLALLLVCWPDWRRDPRLLGTIILANLAILIGVLWWLGIVVRQVSGPASINIAWMKSRGAGEILHTVRNAVFMAQEPRAGVTGIRSAIGIQIILFLAALFGAVRSAGDRKRMLVPLCLAAALLFFLIVQARTPVMFPRTLLWLNLFVAILAGIGIAELPGRLARAGAAAVLALCLASNVATVERQDKAGRLAYENWIGSADLLGHYPGATVVVLNPAVAVLAGVACDIAMKGAACPYQIVMIEDRRSKYDYWSWDEARSVPPDQLDALLTGAPTVFLFSRLGYNPDHALRSHGICAAPARKRDDNLVGPLHFHAGGPGECRLVGE